jgi:iron complex outermembrane receptor protein
VNDSGSRGQVGFRAEWDTSGGQLGVQADAYSGDEDQPAPGMFTLNGISRLNPISISGANVLARWARRLDGGSDITLLAYYDRTERDVPGTFLYTLDVIDLQFQQSFAPGGAHTTAWGAEYRHGSDHIVNDDFIAFLPAKTDRAWVSLFAQDEIALREDLKLVVGARLEHNDYTGNEFLPSARLAWNVTDDHLVWAAASRTARAPSRIDRDFYFPATAPFLIQGGANFQSEVADVYEVGYRGQISPRVTVSATAFRTQYDHLRTLELAPSGTYVEFANEMDGTTSGVEMWGTFEITADWRLGAGYAALHKHLALKPGSDGLNGGTAAEGNDPDHAWQLRSTHDLFARWQLDAIVRQVASLPLPSVPRYLTADVRVGVTVRPGLEVSLTGRNLVGGSHSEFREPETRTEFDREVFVKVVVARR